MKRKTIISRKREIQRFKDIDEKIKAQIPNLNQHQDVVKISDRIDAIRNALTEINKKLRNSYDKTKTAQPRWNDNDGSRVLENLPLEGEVQETSYARLLREKNAHEKAVTLGLARRRELVAGIVRDISLSTLEPVGKTFSDKTLSALENLCECIEQQERFYSFLSHQGYKPGYRGSLLESTPFELLILYGGGGWPAGRYYVDQRRTLWKKRQERNQKRSKNA